jgi:hypothetical protein
MSFGSPFGAPPFAHLMITSFSDAVRLRSLRKLPCGASACHGGIVPSLTSSLIDLAHGRTSSYVISDIGAISPGR